MVRRRACHDRHVKEESCLGGRAAHGNAADGRAVRDVELLGFWSRPGNGWNMKTNAFRRRFKGLMIQMTDWAAIRGSVRVVVPHAPERRSQHDQQEKRQRQEETPNSLCVFVALTQDDLS